MSSLTLNKEITIQDPISQKPKATLLNKFLLKLINDERDLPIIKLILKMTFSVIPLAIFILLSNPVNIYISIVYLLLTFGYFFAPYVLMLHNISHRKLFKKQYSWLNYYPTWILGIFFGESPETYYSHHIGMHHPENNLRDDRSTTITFRRDSFLHFMYYYLRFFFWGIIDLTTYLYKRKRYSMIVKTVFGELSYILLMVGTLYYNFWAGIILFVVPFMIARFGMMAGNWGQHAFVDIDDPNNCHRNSLTCINSSYNKRGFNDGYHISHHLKGSRHWSEHPLELIENKDEYIKERAIVFQKLDFFGVWLLLMLKQHKRLAKYYVNLDDKKPKSIDQILEIFESRLVPVKNK